MHNDAVCGPEYANRHAVSYYIQTSDPECPRRSLKRHRHSWCGESDGYNAKPAREDLNAAGSVASTVCDRRHPYGDRQRLTRRRHGGWRGAPILITNASNV